MQYVTPPPIGQTFVDDSGTFWVVQNVISSPGSGLEDFFLVRMNHGQTEEALDGTLVLAPSEYQALVRSRQLKPLAPDVLARNAHAPSGNDPHAGRQDHFGGNTAH